MEERTKRRIQSWSRLLFVLYLLLLGYALLFAEEYGRKNWMDADYRYNLELFREIKRFWDYREQLGFWPVFLNIGGNIIGFLPFGMLLPVIDRKFKNGFVVLFLGAIFSLSMEIMQLFLKVGSLDVDDLVLNTLGVLLGYMIYRVFIQIKRMRDLVRDSSRLR